MTHNPLLKGFYPDPTICRVKDTYYLAASSFAYTPSIPVFQSRDMEHWTQIGHALERRSQLALEGAAMSEGIYAPCLRYHDGRFYMITTNVSGGGNFYVTAKKAEGPWSDPVFLTDAPGIDPSLYFEKDRCFYIGQRTKKEAAYFGDCEIWLQELDLKRGKLTGETYVLWDGAMKNAYWPEGPRLYRRNGYYYLLIAEGGTGFSHSICAARSRSLYGPYEGCPMNPVFTHRHLGRGAVIQNTGHGDMVETPDGQWYMVLLGTRPLNGCAPLGRETFLTGVEWEEDWPVAAPGEGMIRVTADEEQNGAPAPVRWEKPLDKRCVFFRYPEEDMYRTREDGKIELKALPQTLSDKKPPAYIGVRVDSTVFAMETTVEFCPGKGQEAGLVYLYDEQNHIRCVLTGSDCAAESSGKKITAKESTRESLLIKVTQVIKGLKKETVSIETQKTAHRIRLSLDGLKLSFFADEHIIAAGIDVSALCAEQAGGFVGCTAGIYAASLPVQSVSPKEKENGCPETDPYAVFSELKIFHSKR